MNLKTVDEGFAKMCTVQIVLFLHASLKVHQYSIKDQHIEKYLNTFFLERNVTVTFGNGKLYLQVVLEMKPTTTSGLFKSVSVLVLLEKLLLLHYISMVSKAVWNKRLRICIINSKSTLIGLCVHPVRKAWCAVFNKTSLPSMSEERAP